MNRYLSLVLAFLLLFSASGCVGQAAAPEAEPEQTSAAIPRDTEPEEPYIRLLDPSKPMVALTFDDGPDAAWTDHILDVLEENHALATFFMIGENVRKHPETVRRMVDMGCEAASHSYAHDKLSEMTKEEMLADLTAADQAFLDAGVEVPALVRPPYGAVNDTVTGQSGRAMITWTVDTLDWKSRDSEAVIDFIQDCGDLDGEILLLHSIHESTAQAMDTVIPWLLEQGYQLVTVTELMACYYGEIPAPDHFYGSAYFSTHDRTDTPLDPSSEPEEPYVRVIDPSKPMVALTFDDGPDGTWSGKILDTLEKNHALATFFEVGRNVAAYPDIVKRMADMGCEVASHSNAHKDLSKLKKAALLRDLDTADQAFVNAGVDAPTLVRPPYGAVNKTVKTATGRTMITWTVDTMDWKSRDAQTVIDYIQNYGNLDGEIVLMHSLYESTAKAMETVIPWLQEQGYQLVTVTELMAYYYGELPQPNHFYGYTYFSTHGRTDTPVELPAPAEEAAQEDAPAEEGQPEEKAA